MKNTQRDQNYENLIHISDWYPTILDATGCSINKLTSLDGYSHWQTFMHKNDDIYHPRQEILHIIDPLSDTDGTEKRKFKSGQFKYLCEDSNDLLLIVCLRSFF